MPANFRKADIQKRIDLAWSLSLPKGIKKAMSPFRSALFAREEADYRN
jgi:hypothetical protein